MLEINVTFNKYSGKEPLNLQNRHIFYISQTFLKSPYWTDILNMVKVGEYLGSGWFKKTFCLSESIL